MTITRPLRRMTLHLSQIFFTLGLTFTIRLLFFFLLLYYYVFTTTCLLLLVPVNDSTSSEIVWTQFHDHTIFRQDADVVLSHLPADVGENFMSIGELDAEHRIR
jgi:hypothetical protein